MKSIRILLLVPFLALALPAPAAADDDPDWAAFGHMLTLMQSYVGAQPVRLAVIHAQAPAAAEVMLARARQMFAVQEAFVDDLAVSLAVHLGPGCLGIVCCPV